MIRHLREHTRALFSIRLRQIDFFPERVKLLPEVICIFAVISIRRNRISMQYMALRLQDCLNSIRRFSEVHYLTGTSDAIMPLYDSPAWAYS